MIFPKLRKFISDTFAWGAGLCRTLSVGLSDTFAWGAEILGGGKKTKKKGQNDRFFFEQHELGQFSGGAQQGGWEFFLTSKTKTRLLPVNDYKRRVFEVFDGFKQASKMV